MIRVVSDKVQYTEEAIVASYSYDTTLVEKQEDGTVQVTPKSVDFQFKTEIEVPKVGLMLVGLGGNNGTTVTAGILANQAALEWETREGKVKSNYYGSVTQASTVRVGQDAKGKEVYIPMKDVLPMVNPNDLVIGGWDISSMNLGDGMDRAEVLDVDLKRQLREQMSKMVPLPSVYYPDFIAANQTDRADNVIPGDKACEEHVEKIRQDIRDFKAANGLDKVIILWTANTERFAEITEGVHDTEENLMAAIKAGHEEIAPSQIFAVASILEGCAYINGSPQNTFVPAIEQMAEKYGIFIGGDDFKSGQTKMKSVLVDFLVSAGLKPTSIVSYNHLGNNDGCNLSAPKTFRSKEISKSNVVDDMVESNEILYAPGEHPDHVVVIKYVPYVGDSKRAMDEYTSEIFMGGKNTIVMHNTCEDSLLATPLIIDLVILTELFQRVTYKTAAQDDFVKMNSILTVLSYLLKAPKVPKGHPVINALFKQRQCIENILRACLSLPAENNMYLEQKCVF